MNVIFKNPFSNQKLRLEKDGLVDETGVVFPSDKGAVRLVSNDNYTDNFGFQWNKFQKTQIDREKKNFQFSKERFFVSTDWQHENLQGKNILEVGSGAGRFSSIVLEETKANLYSID